MASRTAQSAAQSAKRVQNEFGSDLWVKDPSKTYRHSTGGRGMFAGLQDAKHYNVEEGWARRAPENRPGFFSWLYNRILTAEIEGSSWRRMRAWMTMMMATAAARSEESKMILQQRQRLVLVPARVSISTELPSPMAALAMRMRQNAQRRTMTTMEYSSPFPFLAPLSQTARRRHRSYPRPRRLPARAIIPPSPATRLKLPIPKILTKALPLTVVSLALAAATASWVVSIVLHPIKHFQLLSSSTPASPLADPTAPRRPKPTTTIPPPHQIYDEAMYNDPAFSAALMAEESGRGRYLSFAPIAYFFLPDAREERTVLRERYDYSFWVDGMSGTDS
ncbi:hypothetical protein AOR_1_1018174 [Paecilomyces variotii No. 5]|uniref:Uncharacterized protein n=1 Tax=Byssochlamys spectabilis (strain No. 5 / NBRC 109023) TaxID=1356009 RepID=V5G037_BYSSN|nr:hypothetical protein AOR_1_1018174 [Paecilomyces variotii No. 5]